MAGSPPERVSRGFKGEVKHHSPFEPPSSSRLSSDDSGSEPESSGKMDASTFGYSSGSSPTKSTLDEDMDVGMAEFMRMRAAQVTQPDVLNHRTPSKRKRNDLDDEEANDPTANGGKRNAVQGMMAKMGWSAGTGLGKSGQGRQEALQPVPKSNQLGLGFERAKSKVLDSDLVWQPGEDQVSVTETVEWIPLCTEELPDENVLSLFKMERKVSEKVLSLDDEHTFCDPILLQRLLRCKSALDDESDKEIQEARSKANPFETVGKHFFQNRAALKMANMDRVFDFMFTNPLDSNGKPLVVEASDDLLFFADVCAGPGGFSEYVLWRKQWQSHGFGFTLEGKDDFKLHNFQAGPPEAFEPFHGAEDMNSVYNKNNLTAFANYVHKNTSQNGTTGVHFMMADGGFSVDGQENIQEILSKRLYLCQFLCALMILREGGHFVCKLFDIFTPFSVGLIYLMYRCFKSVCIHKPNTSRPANSERYIICKGLHGGWADVRDYLFAMNVQFDVLKPNEDIYHSVPMDYLMDDESFCGYIKRSNETLGNIQCLHLAKTIIFINNQHDERERQDKLRSQCLAYWDVPDKRPSDVRGKLDQSFVFTKLSGSIPFGKAQFTILPEVSYCTKDQLRNILNYRGVFFGGDLILLLGLGLSDVRYVPLKGNKFDFSGSTWDKVSNRPDWKDLRFPIPAETLVVGEIVEEFHGETQRKIKALHIIDAYALGKVVVGGLPYEERIRRARKFARAIRQNPPASVVRVKPVHKAREFLADISRLQPFKPRNMRHCITLAEQLADNALYGVHGMHFIKIVTDPWTMVWSKTSGSPYCFNPKDGKQTMDLVPGVFANSTDALNNWIVWKWSSGNVIDQRTQTQVKDTMHELLEHAKFPKSTPKH